MGLNDIYIYRKCGLVDIVEKLKISQMKDFDTHELRGIFVDPTVEKFKKVQHSDQFAAAVLEANDIYALGLHISVIISF